MKKKTQGPAVEIRLRNLLTALHKALPTLRLAHTSARVREVPDERTLRYYTTVGLLAPPLRLDGRRALYGKIHLLQLLAVKQLQSQGQPLKNIETLIRSAPAAKLCAIANVDDADVEKTLRAAAADRSADLWPRRQSSVSTPHRPARARGAAAAVAGPDRGMRFERVADGVYLVIDSKVWRGTREDLAGRLNRLMSHARF